MASISSFGACTPFFRSNTATVNRRSPSSHVQVRPARCSAAYVSAERMRSTAVDSSPSLYEVLGIHNGATSHEIKTAYRRLARVLHPDVASAGRKDESANEFMRIREAYETLTDPAKRDDYDRTLFELRRPMSFSFRPSVSEMAMTAEFSCYTRRWETDQCW